MSRGVLRLLLALGLLTAPPAAPLAAQPMPNIVIIFVDDMGYADIGPFGATGYRTPNLDRMAQEGTRFTSFYAAQAVCSASRAALLTGSYPNRIGINGALGPNSKVGISDGEVTIAELLKSRGYATAIFGKWHLGDRPPFLPTRHGFDEYFGLPYSNDMWPNHPEAKPGTYPPLPLIEQDTVLQLMPDQSQLTRQYTERAVRFIERNARRPFFLYVPHTMVHVPLFVGEKFRGTIDGRPVWRCRSGARLERWRDPEGHPTAGPGSEHAGDLHLRQRTVALVWRACRFGRAAARRQGHGVGRRRARPIHRAMAGNDRCRTSPRTSRR